MALSRGSLEMLAIVDTPGISGRARMLCLLEGLLGRRYRTARPVSARRRHLRALGLVERTPRGEALTREGRRLLDVRAHLADLDLPEALLAAVAAALSSGKHLLLTGPPGTGKTELGLAIGAAARATGHCDGLVATTASADWTSFDTLGVRNDLGS